jgi:hypothetical protein
MWEAAWLIRAALTGDEFTINRIVTHTYEDDLDWRSFANEVTYTAAVLIVAFGSKAKATTLLDRWLDSLARKRMAAASPSRAARYAVLEPLVAEVSQPPPRSQREPRHRGGMRFELGAVPVLAGHHHTTQPGQLGLHDPVGDGSHR